MKYPSYNRENLNIYISTKILRISSTMKMMMKMSEIVSKA